MTRSVADAAAILTVIAGRDPSDNITLTQPETVEDYTKALVHDGLKGVRLGVPRLFGSRDPNIMTAFNESLQVIRELGATIIDPAEFPAGEELLVSDNDTVVLETDFKVSRQRPAVTVCLIVSLALCRLKSRSI